MGRSRCFSSREEGVDIVAVGGGGGIMGLNCRGDGKWW